MRQKNKLAQLNRILEKIHSYKEYMAGLETEELQGMTDIFLDRLEKG